MAGGVLQAGLGPARDVDGGPRLTQLQRDPSPDTTTRPRHQAHLGRWRYLHLAFIYLQGVSRVSAKVKLKNRHFTGGYRGSKPFFLFLQSGSKFPMDKRSIKDIYYSPFQQQEKSAKLQILHF